VSLLFDNLPPGFRYRQDFVTGDEEMALVRHIQGMEFADVRMRGVTARRRVRQFGWHYSFESWRLSEGEGISLLSACVFKLRRGDRTGTPINIELAPRSAYVLDGEARRDWQHSIPAVKRMRYSITFRTLRDATKGTKKSL
jgi:DNA oxidative demethylase